MSKASAAVRPLTGIRKFISVKAKRFIEGYEAIMLKRFPSTYRMIQMFTTGNKRFSLLFHLFISYFYFLGTKDFSSDVLQYMKTSKDLAFESRTVADLSHKELVNYMSTPKALRKMTPFLLISSVPFAQYVTLPLAFWFPKQLLSRHYWNIEQKTRFAIQDHTKRLNFYRPVFRHLQKKLDSIKETEGDGLHEKCRQVFARLGSGTHPSVSQTLALSPLFTSPSGPYELNSLSHAHLLSLCKIHATSILPGMKIRLKKHIYFVKELDNAWTREGDEEKSLEDLKQVS